MAGVTQAADGSPSMAYWQQDSFRQPEAEYLARVFAWEEPARCWFGAPVWTATRLRCTGGPQTRLTGGDGEDLAGVSQLRFDDGLAVEERFPAER
jgi:hypothetical protein